MNRPPEGVYGLTAQECSEVEERYLQLGTLLGQTEESARQDAQNIVDEMRRSVFYLIPPKPNSDPDIKSKVESIMMRVEQMEMFPSEDT